MKYLLKCDDYYIISIDFAKQQYQRTKKKKEAYHYESIEAAEADKKRMAPFMFFTKWKILPLNN